MVSAADARKAAAKLDFKIPEGHEKDYVELLKKTDDACRAILAFEGEFRPGKAEADYKPKPDLERWPRKDVHLPTDNPLRAWAWKCDSGEVSGDNLLSGKTVVLKDTICMAGVPLLFGTNAFEGYTRESG
jgi:amidase